MNLPIPLTDHSMINEIIETHPTPFYVYHEEGIRRRCRELFEAFSWNAGFQQFFAIKATPNPNIVAILVDEGCGADCSSPAELELCRRLGIDGQSIIFTSNNTTMDEFRMASEINAIVNLDTPDHLDKIAQLPNTPDTIAYRFNPGAESSGNAIIGDPEDSKFGCTRAQITDGYVRAKEMGVTSFGLHAMIVSNELSVDVLLANARMLFELAVDIGKMGVEVDFINLGGGIGIPYLPTQSAVDLSIFGDGVRQLFEEILEPAGLGHVRIMTENGRSMTGPFGYLVSRVINTKNTFKNYVGIDASMSNLMRPGMYGAYHHVSVLGRADAELTQRADVVGSLCENNDKFAVDRELPTIEVGDLLLIHDAGAHGHSMGFQYNGRLRCAEFVFNDNGQFRLIRRAETFEDYFATVEFPVPHPMN